MLNLDRQNEWRELYRRSNPNWKPATESFAALVRNQLQPNSRILDLGCGRGGLVEQLDFPLNQIVGIDPDWESLATHRLTLPRVAGFGRLPFQSNQFDIIYASWVLEHWQHPLNDLGEIQRVLKPGGVFVFITPNKNHPLIRLNQVVARLTARHGELVTSLYARDSEDTFPAFYRASSPFELKMLAQHSGLQLTTLQTIPDPTYLAFSAPLFRLMQLAEAFVPAQRKLHLVGAMTKRTVTP